MCFMLMMTHSGAAGGLPVVKHRLPPLRVLVTSCPEVKSFIGFQVPSHPLL